MASASIVKYLNPWKYRRELEAERLRQLLGRDGDCCARCRRPLRFDLPDGHDQCAKVEEVAAGRGGSIDNLRLTHRRCFAPGMDHTGEVTERMRRKNEAALFAKKPRAKKTKAA